MTDGVIRVFAVADLHRERVHGITRSQSKSAGWVREICDRHGPLAAVQCVDLIDISDLLREAYGRGHDDEAAGNPIPEEYR